MKRYDASVIGRAENRIFDPKRSMKGYEATIKGRVENRPKVGGEPSERVEYV